jgi:hypothetical protein
LAERFSFLVVENGDISMVKTFKNCLLWTIGLLLLFLGSSQVSLATNDAPLLPMTVEGTATIDGSPAPVGTVIAAYLDGNLADEFIVNSSSGNFYLDSIEGVAEDEGKAVTFTVDGKDPGKSFTWESGKQVYSLKLAVGKSSSSSSGSSSDSNSKVSTVNGTEKTNSSEPEYEVIESSIPKMNVTDLESAEGEDVTPESEETEAASGNPLPGFSLISVACMLVAVYGYNKRK